MKKILFGLMMVLLVCALVGCGSSGGGQDGPGDSPGTGKTMTTAELKETYTSVSTVTACVGNAMSLNSDLQAFRPSITSANCFVNAGEGKEGEGEDPPLTWSGPDSNGWYTASEIDKGTTFNYKMRFLEITKTIEFITKYVDVSSNDYTKVINSTKGTNNLWTINGEYTVVNAHGTTKIELIGSEVNDTNCSGTYDIWVTAHGIARHNFSKYTVTYDSNHNPTPFHMVGWSNGDPNNTFDKWISLASEGSGSEK